MKIAILTSTRPLRERSMEIGREVETFSPKKCAALITEYDLVIIGSRFVYGFRIATPVVLGTSRVPAWQYSLFNMIGAALWALLITNAGYFLGGMMERLLGDLHKIQKYIAVGILLIGIGLWLWHRFRAQREAGKD